MSAPVREGDLLDGKYRVERVLGQGGMGVVVAATHIQLGERVALKFLLPAHEKDREVRSRFEREARSAARIRSPHVARVTDVGHTPSGGPYLVMEYLAGMDLQAMLDTRGPLPIADAVDFTAQACLALAEAHRVGVVHRDMKPANLFLTRANDGTACIKLLDFGISKVQAPEISRLTNGALGTPEYMSPEQLRDASSVDARCDFWGVGLVLHQLLVKQHPFHGLPLGPLLMAILQQPAPSLRALRAEVPAALEAVVHRCLEKEPARRYPDAGELARALLPFASPVGRAAIQSITALSAQHAPPSTPVSHGTGLAGTWRTDDGAWPASSGSPTNPMESGPPRTHVMEGGSQRTHVMDGGAQRTNVMERSDRSLDATKPMGAASARGRAPLEVTRPDPLPASLPGISTRSVQPIGATRSAAARGARIGVAVGVLALAAGTAWVATRPTSTSVQAASPPTAAVEPSSPPPPPAATTAPPATPDPSAERPVASAEPAAVTSARAPTAPAGRPAPPRTAAERPAPPPPPAAEPEFGGRL